MKRYEHGGDIYTNAGIDLDFSANVNPLGMPDEVRSAIINRADEYARYPDPYCGELRCAISDFENIDPEWILCGNGAADLIYRLCYAVKPRKALICAPTFSEYELALRQTGCEVLRHALTQENKFVLTPDIAKALAPGVDMLFLCNPNNPTGRLIKSSVINEILAAARKSGTIVVIDECFLDFTRGISSKNLLADIPELVVLKAFTKMYAMAGLRLGYMLSANAELLNKTDAASQCWSVSSPAQAAGIAALSCKGWAEKTRQLVAKEREFMINSLSFPGMEVFPSEANFLLFRCKHPLYEPLLKKGILIRKCGNFAGLNNSYYRAAIKTHPENIRLIQAAEEILNTV
ncbi:MAG: threonine-phosphate decarboxylase CobD [Clostridiales bacterium]|nr:threonine-phosphate decarboxylase CobD [Clostridiales bacterium]